MITKIGTKDLRGHSLTVELDKFTAIGGKHGAGKTSLIMAAHYALLGYYPGDDKLGAAIMANCSGDSLGVAVIADEHNIGRQWTRDDKGSIKATGKIDGVLASGKALDGMIQLALGGPPKIFDGVSFWGLSDKETRKAILRLTAGDKADELLDLDAKPREALNKARADRQAAEKSLANATSSLLELPQIAGDIGMLNAKIEEDRQALEALQANIAAGDQADEERKRLLSCIAIWDDSREAERQELQRTLDTMEKSGKTPRPIVPDSLAPIPQWVKDRLKDLLDYLDAKDDTAGFNMLEHILKTELEVEEARKKATLAGNEWDAAQREDGNKRVSLSRRIGELNRMGTEARTAKGRLAKLPVSPIKIDRQAAEGMATRIKENASRVEGATRRAQVERMVEQYRSQVEKCRETEETAKAKMQDASTAMAEALIAATGELKEKASKILPTGELGIGFSDEKIFIGWYRENIGMVQRRSLSGSERVVFDAAVAHALLGENCTAFIDAGEVGNDALVALAPLAERCPCQIVLCRWTDSHIKLPKMARWKIVEL